MATHANVAGKPLMTQVCIIGGGPAGSALARRLQQSGLSSLIVEKRHFPRPHIGESLVNGILPLLATLGIRAQIEQAGFLRPQGAIVRWAAGTTYRPGYGAPGFQVDRSRFDTLLLQSAIDAGAQVLQPAQAVKIQRADDGRWEITVQSPQGKLAIKAQFLVDATGRSGIIPGRKHLLGARTLALYAYWRGLPLASAETRVEAAPQAWYWGAPLPDGTFNATVLIATEDYAAAITRATNLTTLYENLLANSKLLAFCLRGNRQAVKVCDATAYYDDLPVTMEAIKIGDAACAIDPLSSQGVQVALGSAIQAAAVINTILHRPADAPSAIDFYHQRQQQTRKVHASAATQFYQEALPTYDGKFWQRRAIMPNLPSTTTTPTQTVNILANELNLANYPTTAYPITNDQTNHSNHFANSLLPTTKLQLNPAVKFLAVPTLQEHWIVPAIGISGHTLPTPVVYLGGIAIAELLTHLPPIITVAQVLQHWSTQLSAMQSLAILNWLGQRDILSIIN